jgi:hypothetical protein
MIKCELQKKTVVDEAHLFTGHDTEPFYLFTICKLEKNLE